MSDSSCDDASSESSWVPYGKRPEWSDVKPVEQDEGPTPVVRIAYSDKFADVYGYFRAIVCSGEVSERCLSLTADALDLNPANYTVWHHRRFLLKELKYDIHKEMDLCRDVIEEHPKNYQVWQHRRVLVEWLADSSKELRLTEIVLSNDAKNYHAWQHRQWVISTFGLFDSELEYVERLLEEDVRNNSAWNQRFFIVSHTAPKGKITGEILDREVTFALEAITKVPGNESSWNYLRGLLDRCEDEDKPELRKKLRQFCWNLFEEKGCRSIYLLATMVDVEVDESDSDQEASLQKAIRLCHSLATEYDKIRQEYWGYMAKTLESRRKA